MTKAKNVSDVMLQLGINKDLKKQTEQEINKRSLSKFLFKLRCDKNLTQKQIAEKIGCTQSKISKLESAYDDEITVKDLLDYSNALNLQLEMGFRTKGAKFVDLIKYHAFKIKFYLEKLVRLAQKDSKLDEGIGEFHEEVLINILKIISDSVSKLDFAKKKFTSEDQKQQIHISTPINIKNNDLTTQFSTDSRG